MRVHASQEKGRTVIISYFLEHQWYHRCHVRRVNDKPHLSHKLMMRELLNKIFLNYLHVHVNPMNLPWNHMLFFVIAKITP